MRGGWHRPPRRVKPQEGWRRAAEVNDATRSPIEATGETVGEAKWAALRELERLVAGLDRDAFAFQVALRGRARAARRRLHAGAGVATRAPGDAAPRWTSTAASALRRSCADRDSFGAPGTCRQRATTSSYVTLVGATLGVAIGRHGQTLDALQYLANAILHTPGRATSASSGGRRRRLPRPPREQLEALARRRAEGASDRAAASSSTR